MTIDSNEDYSTNHVYYHLSQQQLIIPSCCPRFLNWIGLKNLFKSRQSKPLVAGIRSKKINKYLSEIGYCSRRAADKLIEQGRVTINGEIPEIGTKISGEDQVCVNGKIVSHPKKKEMVYLAFNKPAGIVFHKLEVLRFDLLQNLYQKR